MFTSAWFWTAWVWVIVYVVTECNTSFRNKWPMIYCGREELRSIANILVLMVCGIAHVSWGWYHSELLINDEQWPLLEWVLWSMVWYNIGDTIVLWWHGKFAMHWKLHHSMLFACIGSILYTRAFPQFVPICCSFEVTSFLYQLKSLAQKDLIESLRSKVAYMWYRRFYMVVYIALRMWASIFTQIYLWTHLFPLVNAHVGIGTEPSRSDIWVCFWITALGAEGLVLFSFAAIATMFRLF